MDNLIGPNLGRYQIIEQLGAGGMAVVYKAYDPQLEREVAIKVIRRGAFPPDQMNMLLKRFNREAKMLAGLAHPNIVKVLDFGEEKGMPYLVMEYIIGGSLKDKLKSRKGKPVPWQDAAKLLAPIARALEAAHKHEGRIIHRDVKPANILIDKYGTPMLTDFGIAKVLETSGTSDLTASGVGIGTPDYMAPEQWLGQAVGPQVDMYALGVVFFEMLTGQRPYHADTPQAVMIMKMNEPLPRPSRLVPGLPETIEHILFKALARNPEDRYADMGKFAAVLEELSTEGDAPTVISQPSTLTARSNRFLPFVILGGISFIVLAAILGWSVFRLISLGTVKPPSTANVPLESSVIPTNTIINLVPSETSLPTLEVSAPVTRDQAELVFVPEGEFLMGSNPDEPYFWGAEAPKHSVYLKAFWIYRTEVTSSMYRACVDDGGCPAPDENSSHTHPNYFTNPEFDGYPVIYVTYADASTYCEWAGARLPSEAEWEKAARGTDGDLFPWGNGELQNNLANFCDQGCPDQAPDQMEKGFNDGYADVAPVGSYPAGASPFGALDMAGNVLEWVSDWYSVDYYSHSPYTNPAGPDSGTKHIIRGGSWWSARDGLRPAARASKSLDYSSDMVGFRCAVDIP